VKDKKWNVHFYVEEAFLFENGQRTKVKNATHAEISMDFEDVMLLMKIVNSKTQFSLEELFNTDYKSMMTDARNDNCWKDYRVKEITKIDFNYKSMYITVKNGN
jgi:hypothetical protein